MNICDDRLARAGTASARTAPLLVGPILTALVLTALGAASCGNSSLGDRDSEPGAGSPANISLTGEQDPRVDLPGRVSVFFQVENGDGSPAAGLTGADFDIFEGGVLVSQSESFQQIRSDPQTFRSYLHLLIDRSNSVQSAGAQQVEDSARQFIELLMPENVPSQNFIKVSWFDGSSTLNPIPGHDIGFSNDREALLDAIDDLNAEPPLNASTNLYGAVDQGLDDLEAINTQAFSEVPNRSLTLVTFTDGTHQAGGSLTVGDLVGRLQAGAMDPVDPPAAPTVTPFSAFTIGVGQEIDPLVLGALGPNGSVAASDFNVLQAAFLDVGQQVQDLANSFYSLAYCSPKTGGPWVLEVSVRGQPSTAGNISFEFSADGFGAGCAFLDVQAHPQMEAPLESIEIADAVEVEDGVVAVGWRSSACSEPGCGQPSRAFVARYRASDETAQPGSAEDGRLDRSFGDDGILFLEELGQGFQVSGATSIEVVESTGELIVGGWARASAQTGFSQAALWRVTADGSGAVRTLLPAGNADSAITSLERTGTGELLAGGHRGLPGARTFALWRLFPDLTLDAGFGADGLVLDPPMPTPGNGGATDLVVGGGNRVYAVGEVNQRIRVLALDQITGARVSSFGGDGAVDAVSVFGGADHACSPGGATLDGSGRLVISGTYSDVGPGGPRTQPAVWRILDSGAADTTFSGSAFSPSAGTGVATLRTGSTNDRDRDFGRSTRLDDVTIGPDGTILVVGERENLELHNDVALLAFDDNGVPEGDYNFVGFVIHDGATDDNSYDRGTVVRVLDSGAIWALGASRPGGPAATSTRGEIPTVWVDRDPTRAFAPIGD